MKRVLCALAATLALGACGQMGPLYLPDANGNVITRPTHTPPEAAPTPATPLPK